MTKNVPVWLTIGVAMVTLVLGSFTMRIIDSATGAVSTIEMQTYVDKEIIHTEERWEAGNSTVLQFMESQTTLNGQFIGHLQDIAIMQAEMRRDIEHLDTDD